jgi:type VI secretion system secreted protein VgrG
MEADRYISVLGDAAKDLLFLEMRGSEALGRPFEYQLDLLSANFDIDLDAVLGQSLTVRMTLASGEYRYVNGVVTQFKLVGTLGRYARYFALLHPSLLLLERNVDCRIYQGATVPDIVAAILRKHGFALDSRLQGSYSPSEFVVQYRESTFHFINRLLEREGIYYYFEHDEGSHKLVLCDAPAAHSGAPECDGVPLTPQSPGRVGPECFDTWCASANLVPGAYAARDFNFENPRALPEASRARPAKSPSGGLEVFEYPGRFANSDAGDGRATVRLEQVQSLRRVFEGASSARGLCTGFTFGLTDHPREDQNGKYLVVGVRIDASVEPYESGVAGAGKYQCAVTAVPASQGFRPELRTPAPRIEGPQTAIVVGPAGSEIWTDKHGRVRLQFHWDRYGQSDENSSCWVRVSQAWAGSGWGSVHVPRVGQEVIVEFLEGDPDRPIVTGRVYNGSNLPPYGLPKHATQSGIKSRSTPGGTASNANEIRFEDRKGAEDLFIHAENTQTTVVKGSQSIAVGGNRSVAVGCNESHAIALNRTTDIKENDILAVHGGAARIIDQSYEVTVGDTHSTVVEKDYLVKTTSGQIVLTHGDSEFSISESEDTWIDTANAHVKLEKGGNIEIANNVAQVLLDADGPMTLTNGQCTVELREGKITLTAASEIALQCGGASITLTKDGAIQVIGNQKVTLSGGQSSVELAAAGAIMSGPKAILSGSAEAEVTGALVRIG